MQTGNSYRSDLKEKILEAATPMFYQHGIRKVKMDDIAKRLRISKRTVFEIYADKEDLLLEVLQHSDEANRQKMKRLDVPGTNVIDIIILFFKQKAEEVSRINPVFFEDMQRYPKLLEFFRKRHERQGVETQDFIRRGIDEGYFLTDINFDLVVMVADASVQFIMSNYLYKKYNFKELLRTFMLFYIRGICTSRGVDLLDKSLKEI